MKDKEKSIIKELLLNASNARRFYLKYDVIDKIISLFTSDKNLTVESRWEKLIQLQKRVNSIKYELGENEADVLIQEVIETISNYLSINSVFREEALMNVKLLSGIQKEKVKSLEDVFRMIDKD